MKKYMKLISLLGLILLSVNGYALSLSDDAIERGVSETCTSYLNQVEKSYKS